MSEIEAEIRRQMLEERDRALQNQVSPTSMPTPPLPTGPSYHALPPPSFPTKPAPPYPLHYPPSAYPAQPVSAPALPTGPSAAPKSGPRKGGAWGGLGALGIALTKFGGMLKFLTFGKYILTAGSMFVSILAYSALFGWRFGVGVVLLIFFHEAGHAVAIKRLGYQLKAMVFIPLLGAYVEHNAAGSPADRAQIAIMGPVAGMLAGLACGAVYGMTGSMLWLVLAHFSFFINLFNLAAAGFLDGARVAVLIPPKILLGGLLLNLLINFRSPICWLLLLFALPQITSQWRMGTIDPALRVSRGDQQTYTLAYFALVIFLGFATLTTQDWIWQLRHMPRPF